MKVGLKTYFCAIEVYGNEKNVYLCAVFGV